MSERREHSESKQDDDIVQERRSKHKHDTATAESESKTGSGSKSEHVSNTAASSKEQESSQKEKADDEGSKSSRAKDIRIKANKSQFTSKFTHEDDKKILKALVNSGYKIGSKEFWERIGHKLKLSITVDRDQLYGRIRRLNKLYLKGYKDNISKPERKVYRLSHKLWENEPKPKPKPKAPFKKAKQIIFHEEEEEEEEDKYDVKLEKFVRGLHNDVKFPVAESLDVVHRSKRPRLLKKWNGFHRQTVQMYIAKMDLIRETMEAVLSSSSFPSDDDHN